MAHGRQGLEGIVKSRLTGLVFPILNTGWRVWTTAREGLHARPRRGQPQGGKSLLGRGFRQRA